MIATAKHKSGSSGSCLGYMLGDMLEKDQQVRVIGYNGFALSHVKIEELEKVPTTDEERKEHKTKVWKIADSLSRIFDARAALADNRVNDPFEDYVISCTDGERERLRRVPTAEERKEYKMKELKDGETDDRTLEQILLDEFLAKIGVHGKIEKKLRRKSKKDGKKYTVKEIVEREAMFMAVAHDGTAHPHMHVLTARPDADGKVNDTRNERHRIAATVQALSKKYNLSLKLEGYEVDLEKTNEGYATRVRMREAVKEACQTASSHEELYDLLAEKDVTPTWWVDADTAEDCGMTFTMKDKRGKKHTFSGTQLDRSCLTYSQVEAALARNLAAARAIEERRLAAEKIAREPETFVIHNNMDASLYSYRPDRNPEDKGMAIRLAMLHEAARSILKYYTWGAVVRYNPNEFIEAAVNGKQFGTVRFDMKKARFVDEDSYEGMLENPDEVIQFTDHKGQDLDLFTSEFWNYWRQQLSALKNWIQTKLSMKERSQSVEKVPAPVQPQKQQEAPAPAANPKPVVASAQGPAPVHRPAVAPAPAPKVTPAAQQQATPAPKPAAKPSSTKKHSGPSW